MRSLKLLMFLVSFAFGNTVLAEEEWKAHPSVEKEFQDSLIVFVGTVVKARNFLGESGIDGTFYSIEVTETLKGCPAKSLELYSENSSGRFPMEVGDSYLVFAYQGVFEGISRRQWAIDNCGNSERVGAAAGTLVTARCLKTKSCSNQIARPKH
jgi:hypothetical protein